MMHEQGMNGHMLSYDSFIGRNRAVARVPDGADAHCRPPPPQPRLTRHIESLVYSFHSITPPLHHSTTTSYRRLNANERRIGALRRMSNDGSQTDRQLDHSYTTSTDASTPEGYIVGHSLYSLCRRLTMTIPKSLFIFANLLFTMVLLASTAAAQGTPNRIESPNGRFSVVASDTGISLIAPNNKILLGANNISIDSSNAKIDLVGPIMNIQANGVIKINGAVVQLNGSCKPVVLGQQGFVTIPPSAGTFLVQGLAGSTTVRGC
jgi:hypothetical protein